MGSSSESPFDKNTWYHFTEYRVNFTSAMQLRDHTPYFDATRRGSSESWQLFQLDDGSYQIRNKLYDGTDRQLGVCYNIDEADRSATQPCMLPSKGDSSQRWRILPFGDGAGLRGSYYIQNVANGSDYNMDCHPGNPVFMSSDVDGSNWNPAQHWTFRKLSDIDNQHYATAVVEQPTATPTTSSPTSSPSGTSTSTTPPPPPPSSSGLSSGAKIGIGVGAVLAVALILALGSLLFIQRRKHRAQTGPPPSELPGNQNHWPGPATTLPSPYPKSPNPFAATPGPPQYSPASATVYHEFSTPLTGKPMGMGMGLRHHELGASDAALELQDTSGWGGVKAGIYTGGGSWGQEQQGQGQSPVLQSPASAQKRSHRTSRYELQ